MSFFSVSRSMTLISPMHAWRLKLCLPANTAMRSRNSAYGLQVFRDLAREVAAEAGEDDPSCRSRS